MQARPKRYRFDLWVRKIPLEEGMATHCSSLAWRIPSTRSLAGYSPGGRKSWTRLKQLSMHALVQRDIEFSLSYGKEHSVGSRAWYPVRSPRFVFIIRRGERKFLSSPSLPQLLPNHHRLHTQLQPLCSQGICTESRGAFKGKCDFLKYSNSCSFFSYFLYPHFLVIQGRL